MDSFLGLLTVLFFLLAAGDFTGNKSITVLAGWEGILAGFSAIYLGAAQVLNETYKRDVLPIGKCA
jgi:succinate-acetate transporter protein